MIVGFTGSREGMTLCQKHALVSLLRSLGVTQFHHGCCVGADVQAHAYARALGLQIHGHPGFDVGHPMRAELDGFAVLHETWPPLVRNGYIVVACDVLIAAPLQPEHSPPAQRSGTWATIRRARKIGKRVEVLQRYRDGWSRETLP